MQIDHLGIAVQSLTHAAGPWSRLGGDDAASDEEVPTQKVRVRFVRVGEAEVELLTPTDPTSPVAKFLAARGEGFHHVAFRVPSVDRELERLRAQGARTVDERSRPGARGRRVGFAHPSAFGGVLVEFVEGP